MIIESLKRIEDPRSFHGKEYQLWQILLIAILSILSNGKGYKDIKTFIDVHYDRLNEALKLNWRVRPTADAIRKIIVRVDPKEVERVFRSYHQVPPMTEMRHICVDGKMLNGSFSHTKDTRAQQVFTAFSVADSLVLAHLPLEEGQEILAFQKLLLELNLNGAIVTADALHCQKKLLNPLTKQTFNL